VTGRVVADDRCDTVATTVISNVVPPSPATLPVHRTCSPMSKHSGAPAPFQ